MKHCINKRRFCRTSSHRISMLKNLSLSLMIHERIVTTLPKAKELRPYVEKMITRAKRYKNKEFFIFKKFFVSKFGDSTIIDKLYTTLVDRYKDRFGGYTRIIKCGFRKGDNAPVALIELVDSDVSFSRSANSDHLRITDNSN